MADTLGAVAAAMAARSAAAVDDAAQRAARE